MINHNNNNNNLKGILSLVRLCENESEFLREDAYDLLVSLSGIDNRVRDKVNSLINMSSFIKKGKFQSFKKIKGLINFELYEVNKKKN